MRPATFTCAWRWTGGSPRRPPTRPMTTRWRAWCDPRSTPRGSSRSIPVGPALRHRPRRRRSTIGTTRRPRPSRRNAPSASRHSSARRRASRPPASARPRASRSRSPTPPASASPAARRPRALDGIARTGSSDGSARAASAQLADLDGAAAGEEATRLARDAADATDLEPGAYEVVLSPACVANVLAFLGIYGFNGRAVDEGRSFARLGEVAVRLRHLARRRRHAPDGGGHRLRRGGDAEAPPRAREGRCHERPRPRPPHRQGARRHVDRQRGRRRRPVRGAAGQPHARARLGVAGRAHSVPSSAACSSPTSGTPASSTHARWSSPA